MKRITLALALLLPLALVGGAHAKTAGELYPGNTVNGVFTTALTVTNTGQVSAQFAPGDTIVFRAFALNMNSHKLLTRVTAKAPLTLAAKKATLRYFTLRIPLADDIKFVYGPAPTGLDARYRWTASWVVPALYPTGAVHFQVLAKTWAGKSGTFSQVPVSSAQLTITMTPQVPYGPGPTTAGSVTSSNYDVVLYADTVNGPRPLNAPPRPTGCTQTNVYKQGEQVVVRAYGFQLADGAVLSMDNVTDAHFSVPGQPDTVLNWGQHGPTGQKVWFWANAWNMPADYPLGDLNVHITFTTVGGKSGTLDYPITVIPQ